MCHGRLRFSPLTHPSPVKNDVSFLLKSCRVLVVPHGERGKKRIFMRVYYVRDFAPESATR